MRIVLKAVFLDWYGTLSTSHFLGHWAREGHPQRGAYKGLQEWWHAPESQIFLDGWLRGRYDAEGFIDEIAGHLGLSREFVASELEESYRQWTLLEPETKSLLAELRRRGVRVVLATDNVDACIRWAIPALGLQDSFDDVLSSHEIHLFKGEVDSAGRSGFFLPYLEKHGIGPGESALIDDSIGLAETVERTGIRFLHAPHGTGPRAHLRALLAEVSDGTRAGS
ncbi:hypothetical protein BH11ARM2_BH11ARM2_19440 [soil metagenome]